MKRYFIFFAFSFFIFGIAGVGAKQPLVNKIIVVDPGHGGPDPGSTYKDIYESNINLKISLYLKKELEKRGAIVYLTRDNSYDLSSPNSTFRKKSDFDNRIKIINQYADYYLSIHLNHLDDSRYYGIQVFSSKKEFKNASIMQKYLNSKLNSNRENKTIPKSTYMYNRLTKPGLLIECGFLSNYNERSKLITETYQKKIAKAIANGVIKLNI